MQVNIMEVFDMISALYRKELSECYLMQEELDSIVYEMKNKDITHADYVMMNQQKSYIEDKIVKKQAYLDGVFDARETLWGFIPDDEE